MYSRKKQRKVLPCGQVGREKEARDYTAKERAVYLRACREGGIKDQARKKQPRVRAG